MQADPPAQFDAPARGVLSSFGIGSVAGIAAR